MSRKKSSKISHATKPSQWPRGPFPDHYDKEIVDGERLQTTLGDFIVVVFDVGRGGFGTEYEIEVTNPDGGTGTSTRKFSSIKEALKRGRKWVQGEVEDVAKTAREAKKSPQQKKLEKLSKEVAFFKSHGGGTVGHAAEGALALARAEKEAEERGWSVEWDGDEDSHSVLQDLEPEDRKKVREVLVAWLKDENGKVLASLGGIIDPDKNYSRVIEAELAAEALSRM